MSREKMDDAPDVNEDGLSAEEREHRDRRESLYLWLRSKWRRS